MSLPVFIEDSVTHSAFKTLVIYKINGKENFQLRMVSFDFLNESKEPLKLEKLYPESNQVNTCIVIYSYSLFGHTAIV